MRASTPVPASARAPHRRGIAGQVAAGALLLLLAAPVVATVWTRSTLSFLIPKGGRAALEDASYSTRDWSVALTAVEVKAAPRAEGGLLRTTWTFHYTNTDREAHYVALNVRCLDARRAERARFSATVVLQADTPSGGTVDVVARVPENAWGTAPWSKVVADFLSGPGG